MAINTLFDPKRREEIRKAIDRGESPFKKKTPKTDVQPKITPKPKKQKMRSKKTRLTNFEQYVTNVGLLDAAKSGDAAAAKRFIAEGAEVNGRGPESTTALMFAAGAGHIEIVKMLISKGADVKAKNFHDETARVWAARGRHPEIVELLKKHRAKE